MKILFTAPAFDEHEKYEWINALKEADPDLDILTEDMSFQREEVEGAIVYYPPPGLLARYSHLRIIFSLSAGVESIIADSQLPDVPVIRLMNIDLQALMREYIVYQVLRITRRFDIVEAWRSKSQWIWTKADTPATDWRVLVLGLGHLGRPSAEALDALGFQVTGWSRRSQSIPGIRCIFGEKSLASVLPESDIVICLLPLTAETKELLNIDFFSKLPRGASLINASRSGCLNETDLLEALDMGLLSHATLDVFDTEPLPNGHKFWTDSRINITPHCAAHPKPSSCTHQIIDCLERWKHKMELPGEVDKLLGY